MWLYYVHVKIVIICVKIWQLLSLTLRVASSTSLAHLTKCRLLAALNVSMWTRCVAVTRFSPDALSRSHARGICLFSSWNVSVNVCLQVCGGGAVFSVGATNIIFKNRQHLIEFHLGILPPHEKMSLEMMKIFTIFEY